MIICQRYLRHFETISALDCLSVFSTSSQHRPLFCICTLDLFQSDLNGALLFVLLLFNHRLIQLAQELGLVLAHQLALAVVPNCH